MPGSMSAADRGFTMPAEWEKGLKEAGVKLYPGIKGNSIKAATGLFAKP